MAIYKAVGPSHTWLGPTALLLMDYKLKYNSVRLYLISASQVHLCLAQKQYQPECWLQKACLGQPVVAD